VADDEIRTDQECASKPTRIAAIIVNYRTPNLTIRCLNGLMSERKFLPNLRVIVVDNASGDDSVALLSSTIADQRYAEWVKFVDLPLNGGFGWGNNQAILEVMQKSPRPEAIFLINPDAIIERGALFALVQDMQSRSDAGAIGSQLLMKMGVLLDRPSASPLLRRSLFEA